MYGADIVLMLRSSINYVVESTAISNVNIQTTLMCIYIHDCIIASTLATYASGFHVFFQAFQDMIKVF